jgi:predicted nucleotidyltransferase
MVRTPSPFERLRQREHGRRLAELRQRLQQVLGPADCSVWLFGSQARGDWDGYSDTDLLVVAPDGAAAERWADQLRQALVGDDVLALSSERWRPQAWWRQARNDLDLAVLASGNGFQAQACFFAAQAAEKALTGRPTPMCWCGSWPC